MSTAVQDQSSLMELSLQELTDQAIALGGDYPMATELGHPRHKKTWIKLIERLSAVEVEVVEEPADILEEGEHLSRREMMIAEVERTRQIFEPEPDFNTEEPGFEPEPVFDPENELHQHVKDSVLCELLEEEVEEFGDLDNLETWDWAWNVLKVVRVLKTYREFKKKGFNYKKCEGPCGDIVLFGPPSHTFHLLKKIEGGYLFFRTSGTCDNILDLDDIEKLERQNIEVWDGKPIEVDSFSSECCSFAVGDQVKAKCVYSWISKSDDFVPVIIENIFFTEAWHLLAFSPQFRVRRTDQKDIGFYCGLSGIRIRSAVDLPPPPPEKPPIIRRIPSTPDYDTNPKPSIVIVEEPDIKERGSGRKSNNTSICHVCEGTGNILPGITCLKCAGKGHLSLEDKVLHTAQEATRIYIKKISEQVRPRFFDNSLPVAEVKEIATSLLSADLLIGSERNLASISKAISMVMKFAPAVLPPFPWSFLKKNQVFLAVEEIPGYELPFNSYYSGKLPCWPDVWLFLFKSTGEVENYLAEINSYTICGDYLILPVGVGDE